MFPKNHNGEASYVLRHPDEQGEIVQAGRLPDEQGETVLRLPDELISGRSVDGQSPAPPSPRQQLLLPEFCGRQTPLILDAKSGSSEPATLRLLRAGEDALTAPRGAEDALMAP